MTELSELCPHLSPLPMTKPWGGWLKKTDNPWLKRVWRRVYSRNQNYILIIYGDTGKGKSYSGLKLGRLLDPNFTLKHVVFNTRDFLRLLNSNTLQIGNVILFEELGVAAGRRKWHTGDNQELLDTNQIFRNRNLILIYTVPKLTLADGSICKLAHALGEAMRIDYKSKMNIIKIYDEVRYDEKKNDWDKHRVSFRRNGRTFFIKAFAMPKIGNKLANAYEKMRDAYERNRSEGALKRLEDADQRSPKLQLTQNQLDEMVAEIIRNPDVYMDDAKTQFYEEKVREKFNIGRPNVKRVRAAVKEKLNTIGFRAFF